MDELERLMKWPQPQSLDVELEYLPFLVADSAIETVHRGLMVMEAKVKTKCCLEFLCFLDGEGL